MQLQVPHHPQREEPEGGGDDVAPTESLTTAQNQKAIRTGIMNISQITMFVGVLSGDIVRSRTVTQQLVAL